MTCALVHLCDSHNLAYVSPAYCSILLKEVEATSQILTKFLFLSLTRKVGPVLTCSCGYPSAVNVRHTVPREFCSMLPEDEEAPYYTLNCVNDLDEGDEEMVCRGSFALGFSQP